MKSQTSLSLHSKCMCTCKHTLQWSGNTDTQIPADLKNYICTYIQCGGAIMLVWTPRSFFLFTANEQHPAPLASSRKKASSQKTGGRNLCQGRLFIHFDLEVQMFPTLWQLSGTYETAVKHIIVPMKKANIKLWHAVLTHRNNN